MVYLRILFVQLLIRHRPGDVMKYPHVHMVSFRLDNVGNHTVIFRDSDPLPYQMEALKKFMADLENRPKTDDVSDLI